MSGSSFAIAIIDQNCFAAGGRPGVDVSPAITDHEAGGQVDGVLLCRLQQQSRFWLAAVAIDGVIVIASEEVVQQRQSRSYSSINGFHHAALLRAAAYIGLVGHDD